ncbi:phosphoenolpyruvate carboxylase [Escherichia coli]
MYELLPVARAFSQFLNLANTAEQYHSISPKGEAARNPGSDRRHPA